MRTTDCTCCDFNRMLVTVGARRQIKTVFRLCIAQKLAIAAPWTIFRGEVADLGMFGDESHSAMPQSAASTTGTANMPIMPLSTSIFVLVFSILILGFTGWFWYFIIKSAIREGIKEAGLKIESTVPDGYELVLQPTSNKR